MNKWFAFGVCVNVPAAAASSSHGTKIVSIQTRVYRNIQPCSIHITGAREQGSEIVLAEVLRCQQYTEKVELDRGRGTVNSIVQIAHVPSDGW